MKNINKKNILLIILVMLFVLLINLNGLCSKFNLHLASVDEPWGEGGMVCQLFCQNVRMNTGGDVEITLHPSGEWGGDEEDYMKAMELGELDMCAPAISPLAQSTNALDFLNLPFLFKSPIDKFHFVYESRTKYTPQVEKIIDRVNKETNFELIMISPVGVRDVFSRKPIHSLDDLEGMKIRTMGSPLQVDAFNALGMIATPMPFGETHTALQLGTVDAMELPPDIYMDKSYYEVGPYWMETAHFLNSIAIIVSKQTWNSLPKAYQNIIKQSAIAAGYVQSQWSFGARTILLDGVLQKNAKEVTFLTEEQKIKLREQAVPVLLDKYGERFGMDLIEDLSQNDQIIKKWYEANK